MPECPECNGTGTVAAMFRHGLQEQDCAECLGTGTVNV